MLFLVKNLCSSVSVLTLISRSLTDIRICFLSLIYSTAFFRISSVKYSNATARYTGAESVTINLEFPKLRRYFSLNEGGIIIPAFSCLLLLTFSALLYLLIEFSEIIIIFFQKSVGKIILIALVTSFSDIVFFLETSVKLIAVSAINLAKELTILLSCCLALFVIPLVSDIFLTIFNM